MMSSASIVDLKAEFRRAALEKRDAMAPDVRAAAAEAVAARPLPLAVAPGAIVSAYSPIRSEINPLPLLRRFAEAGASLALPAIAGRGKPLILRAWTFGAPLARGQWNIREPGPEAPEVHPDIMIVPLAAFDRRGYRIGYGAGYYDLTLNALRARKPVIAIGLAYGSQEIAAVPDHGHDARLDLVLTETDVIFCEA
jgi:5-formyltetrahydrofolate cyclo-ligase